MYLSLPPQVPEDRNRSIFRSVFRSKIGINLCYIKKKGEPGGGDNNLLKSNKKNSVHSFLYSVTNHYQYIFFASDMRASACRE